MKYLKSAARFSDRNYFNKIDLDLSKEVLWVSVGQREAKLPAIKVGGVKKNSKAGEAGSNRADQQNFLLTSIFDNPYICCPLTYRDQKNLLRKI